MDSFCRECDTLLYDDNWYPCKKNKPEYICKKCSQKNWALWRKTKKGKIVSRKAKSKSNAKRRRNLQWIQMFENPFDESVEIDYHHITDVYVVAIPKELHQLYLGKFHRERVMDIVKQIYLRD